MICLCEADGSSEFSTRRVTRPGTVETLDPTGETETIDGEDEVVDVECGIIFNGSVVQVTSKEAEALVAYLTQLRMPQLKVA